jgi:hypothetical protein
VRKRGEQKNWEGSDGGEKRNKKTISYMHNELIPIERKEGVTIYGRIIGKGGKLGQYECYSERQGADKNVYSNYSDAQKRMSALIGHKHSQQ